MIDPWFHNVGVLIVGVDGRLNRKLSQSLDKLHPKSHALQEYEATHGQAAAADLHMSEGVWSHVDYHINDNLLSERKLIMWLGRRRSKDLTTTLVQETAIVTNCRLLSRIGTAVWSSSSQ